MDRKIVVVSIRSGKYPSRSRICRYQTDKTSLSEVVEAVVCLNQNKLIHAESMTVRFERTKEYPVL